MGCSASGDPARWPSHPSGCYAESRHSDRETEIARPRRSRRSPQTSSRAGERGRTTLDASFGCTSWNRLRSRRRWNSTAHSEEGMCETQLDEDMEPTTGHSRNLDNRTDGPRPDLEASSPVDPRRPPVATPLDPCPFDADIAAPDQRRTTTGRADHAGRHTCQNGLCGLDEPTLSRPGRTESRLRLPELSALGPFWCNPDARPRISQSNRTHRTGTQILELPISADHQRRHVHCRR